MIKAISIACLAVALCSGITQAQDDTGNDRGFSATDAMDHARYVEYVTECQKKNRARHFGPLLGFTSAVGTNYCLDNGVTCTANEAFLDALKELWDGARARGAYVVWEATPIQYIEESKSHPGVMAYADDGRGKRIATGLNRPY